MVRVPMQRPALYGGRLFMTAQEHAVLEKQEQERIVQMANEGAGGATGAPGHWVEWGKSQRQTSLIVDPPDGRMPALTPEGQARTASAPRGTMGAAPLNGPEDFTMWERCLSRGALGSTLPVLYNSGIDITQGPGLRRDSLRDGARSADHRARRTPASLARDPAVHGRRARPLGGRHAGRRDHELHRSHRRRHQRRRHAEQPGDASGRAVHPGVEGHDSVCRDG